MTNSSRPILIPSLKQGSRGWVTTSSAVPTRKRSPTLTSPSSRPSVVRFSPNVPGPRVELRPLARPELVELGRVGVDGLVRAAVHAQVGLAVAVEVQPPQRHASGDRLFEDPGRDRLAPPEHLARQADVDGEHLHRALPTGSASRRAATCLGVEALDVRGDLLERVLDREVAAVEHVQLGVGQVAQVRAPAFRA